MQPFAPMQHKPQDNVSPRNEHRRTNKPGTMQVVRTRDHIILQKGSECLWCSKDNGIMKPGTGLTGELGSAPIIEGTTHGLIGKLKFFEDSDWNLLLIDEVRKVGRLPPTGGVVYCIEKVSLLPLTLAKCPIQLNMESYAFDKTEKEMKDRDKLERRLKEALLHMFNGSQSFYFSPDIDLTQSSQRQHDCGDADRLRKSDRVDDRFFWNKHMISDLLEQSHGAEPWILPVIQGFIEIKEVAIPSAKHWGVFKKYTPKRKSGDTQDGVALDLNTYTVVEQDGDVLISRSYSSDKDDPFRVRSDAVSSPNIISQEGEGESPEEVCQLFDHAQSPLPSSLPDPTPPLSQLLNHTPELSTTPLQLDTPSNKLIFPNISIVPMISNPINSRKSSPTKSVNKSRDSLNSYDTDEWLDKELEGVASGCGSEDDSIDGDANSNNTWSRGMTREIHWSPDGLPLMTLALISRRSRHRAGTRYLRRGVDEEGHVANYVETEMVVRVESHLLSFMIVRGSVPVFWSQSGQKYRPDPIIHRSDVETSKAFEEHFEQQINLYQEQVIVSLINQSGRERPVGEAYEKQLLMLDCPSLTYVAFDFHHHCKVNQWQNINLLLDGIEEYTNRQHYFWYDSSNGNKDVLCLQKGVFRVNCVDCLDRTNVVQSVICREVLQTALQKLGLLNPFDSLTGDFLRHYQEIWANHGDTISKQYTGTAAMKGDLTRYGQRKLYGVMKDGYNSAHRFIISLFRDAYRQVAIDLQQGVSPSEALQSLPDTHKGAIEDNGPVIRTRSLLTDVPSWTTDREDVVRDMIQTCIQQLYPHAPTIPVIGWVLIEPQGLSFVKSSTKEEETVLLLCKERGHICVANYNVEFGNISCCIRIPLDRIERIGIGQIGNILRSSQRLHMRIFYALFPGVSCYFTFRTVYSKSPEDDKCVLQGIAQSVISLRPNIPLQEQRLSRKPSPPHEGIVILIAPEEWMPGYEAHPSRPTAASPVSPPVDGSSEDSSQMGSSTNVSYVPLGSNSKTTTPLPAVLHSRESSTASSQIGLVNEESFNQSSGCDSDSSKREDIDLSFSVPNSPSLPRRTRILSLEERSRILSHSSMSDLTLLSEEDQSIENLTKLTKRQQTVNRQRLHIFSNNSSDSDEDDEAMHHYRMNSVLSTVRPKRMSKQREVELDNIAQLPSRDEVFQSSTPTNTRKLGDLMTIEEIQLHSTGSPKPTLDKGAMNSSFFDDLHSELPSSKTRSLPNKDRIHSESAPVQLLTVQSSSSAEGASSGGGWTFSRFKGKLFGKVRSVTSDNRSNAELDEHKDSSKLQRNAGRSSTTSQPVTSEKENELQTKSDEENMLNEAKEHSKTRFIII